MHYIWNESLTLNKEFSTRFNQNKLQQTSGKKKRNEIAANFLSQMML